MKHFCILILAIAIISCKNEKETETSTESEKETSLAQQIANDSGIDQWNEVKQINFTFNVDRQGNQVASRAWQWNPQSDEVTLMAKNDTISYKRTAIDSTAINTDRAFVNDVYWLLPQFKLVWDQGTEISNFETKKGTGITLQYTGNGGYTPGDRYDMIIADKEIQEWSYYPAGSTEPAMTTSFEDYQNYNGIKIATDHKTPDGATRIYFTDVSVTK
ncbi:hypothetical protein [Nonlabens ponticola]|uniref:Uncharacterized protein n=1 Tax=Nonlabens ponticola TaxID=2496866 RepID=A0A3S9MUB4_9FLAO|nr:hypothetical protein [Nonlabens ponticola]AZQ42758.1 hypothetical protein EJ995_00355 [Nonlabens ponticola]